MWKENMDKGLIGRTMTRVGQPTFAYYSAKKPKKVLFRANKRPGEGLVGATWLAMGFYTLP